MNFCSTRSIPRNLTPTPQAVNAAEAVHAGHATVRQHPARTAARVALTVTGLAVATAVMLMLPFLCVRIPARG